MSAHIEWLNANYVEVAGTAHPETFHNDGATNDVAALRLVSTFSGDGVIIEGTPAQLRSLAAQIQVATASITAVTAADRKLSDLYDPVSVAGVVVAESRHVELSVVHEEFGRQSLDDQHFEPEYGG